MAKSEIEFAAEQAEKMTELLRNGILVAINEDNTYLYSDVVDYMIAHGATIPVRCKDCKRYSQSGLCNLYLNISPEMKPNDFCSYGERREGE